MKAIDRCPLAIAFLILVAGAFFTLQLVTHSATMAESPTVAASSDAWDARDVTAARDEEGDHVDGADGYLDLYGNEVTDAIATYTFDKSGSLYELHSPQTELPRLGIPKS